MAFLDTSGDIILDAVLTDTGRFRMARGDFRISKFALGDDEIDYSLFNKNHPSGSAYFDLEILRTPLLEAFTNNTSTMKSKLLSINASNILHLPVIKLLNGGNTGGTGVEASRVRNSKTHRDTGGYVITCDRTTETVNTGLSGEDVEQKGIILGSSKDKIAGSANFIALERGLDTTEISPKVRMPATLQETQFIIEADYRLCSLVDIGQTATPIPVSFIDDDQIASYYVSEGTSDSGQPVVAPALDTHRSDRTELNEKSIHNIRGPRDRILQFKIEPSINLTTSNFLFDKLGSTITTTTGNEFNGFVAATYKIIDTLVRVTSATTAYSIDIPVRFIKKQ